MGNLKQRKGVRRPVRRCAAGWDADLQALPPYSWCVFCGMEVYVPGEALCEECKEERDDESANRA